jgi:hypothetical protein
MKRFAVLSLALLCLMIGVQATGVVQFLRQTANAGNGYVPEAGNAISLEEALQLAGVDLNEDTRLSQQQINEFITDGLFVGCFTTPMVDPENEIELGTGIDCLNVDLSSSTDSATALTALSLFVFRGGSLVTFGLTSVGAFAPGIGDASGAVTNITGSIPPDPAAGPSGIVGGTGRFHHASGTVRVSGAVNLNDFPNTMDFDCVWIIELAPRGHR